MTSDFFAAKNYFKDRLRLFIFLLERFLYRRKMLNVIDAKERLKIRNQYEKRVIDQANKLATPESLILYVTMRCNAKCSHCFLWRSLNRDIKEMKLENFETIASSLENPAQLIITGGEPFLRQDLFAIMKIFHKHKKIKSVMIATNGSMPLVIKKFVKRWLKEIDADLILQISVDGLERTHNLIRKIPGGFKKVLKTIQILKKMPKNKVEFEISSTIHKKNINEVMKLVKTFQKREVAYKFTVMRGNSYSTFGLPRKLLTDWDPQVTKLALNPQQIQYLVTQVDKNFPGSLSSSFRAKLLITAETLLKKRRLIPCFAGSVEAVIYANGDVSCCEQVRPFGNLKETNYNFYKLWKSNKANKQRLFIKKCACIHGCNLSTSIMYTSRDIFYRKPQC